MDVLEHKALVVTPHRAAAERLGVPHVSLRSLAERRLRVENIGVASHLTALNALKAAIYRVDSRLDPVAEAGRIGEILGTVLRTGIDLDSLRDHGSARVGFLADTAETYVASLAKRNLIDREAVLWQASQLEITKRDLFIYGYFRARKEEILFIDKIAGDGSVFLLPSHRNSIFEVNRVWIDKLKQHGWETDAAENLIPSGINAGDVMASIFVAGAGDDESLEKQDETRDKPVTSQTALVFPNIEDEVRGTIARAKHLINGGTRPEKIAIVCRTVQSYASMIASVSRQYNLPVEMKHKIPIGQTSVGNFVKLLLESAGPDIEPGERGDPAFEFEVTARMLFHNYGPGLDDAIWPQARKFHPNSFEEWRDLGIDLSILRVPEKQTSTEWTFWLSKVLREFRVRETAGANSAELTTLNRFSDAVDEQSRDQGERVVAYEGFVSDVFDILSSVTTPFDTSSGGVVLHQPNTIIGGEFDHIFVLGMAEGILPAKVAENPIIDFHRTQVAGQIWCRI